MFNNYKEIQEVWYKLEKEFDEMAVLKSDFDVLKFTMDSQWPFICHQWHHVCRQYSIAILELKKMYIHLEAYDRRIAFYKKKIKDWEETFYNKEWLLSFYDLAIEEEEAEKSSLRNCLINTKASCERYEIIRQAMLKANWCPFTNSQYQAEQPEYWKWNIANQAKHELVQRQTGITKWVLQAIDSCSSINALFPEYKSENMKLDDWLYNLDELVRNDIKAWNKYKFQLERPETQQLCSNLQLWNLKLN